MLVCTNGADFINCFTNTRPSQDRFLYFSQAQEALGSQIKAKGTHKGCQLRSRTGGEPVHHGTEDPGHGGKHHTAQDCQLHCLPCPHEAGRKGVQGCRSPKNGTSIRVLKIHCSSYVHPIPVSIWIVYHEPVYLSRHAAEIRAKAPVRPPTKHTA